MVAFLLADDNDRSGLVLLAAIAVLLSRFLGEDQTVVPSHLLSLQTHAH